MEKAYRVNTNKDSKRSNLNNGAKLLTYFNYVLFYLRFVLIYVLSALLELIGVGTYATIAISCFAVVLTFLIVFYIVGDEKHDKSEELLAKLDVEKSIVKEAKCPKNASFLAIIFYLVTEYFFDISCFFGLSRQFILTYYSQSHAIAFLSLYQPIIFIAVAWIVIWLANIKYNDVASKIARQDLIFERLNFNNIKGIVEDKPKKKSILLSGIIALSISFSAFIGVQYYLSGSINIVNPYGLSVFVFMVLSASLLSYVFWGKEKAYWDTIWSGFMAVSGILGFIFFGKIVLMAVFGQLVSNFYSCSGVGIFIGIAVGVGILYSQIIQDFSVREYRVATINKYIDSGKLDIKNIKKEINNQVAECNTDSIAATDDGDKRP